MGFLETAGFKKASLSECLSLFSNASFWHGGKMDFSQIEWPHVLPQLGIDSKFLRKRHGPCPICSGRDRFRFDNKDNMGTWFCSHCGAGNALTLLRKFTGHDDRTILRDIDKARGTTQRVDFNRPLHQPVRLDELTQEEIDRNRKRLTRAWRNSKALTSDPVTLYLQKRVPGLRLEKLGKEIRFLPNEQFWETDENDKLVCRGTYPVMLARVLDGAGTPITLHRTYLTNEGDKAPVATVKKQMGGVRKLNGAAIRLNDVPGCRTLGVCEGIETGAAIVTAYRYKMPVWALLNCGNLAEADIPRGMYDKVIIFADHDRFDQKRGYRPGQHFAEILKARLEAMGFEVVIKYPETEETDFADLWNEYFRNVDNAIV